MGSLAPVRRASHIEVPVQLVHAYEEAAPNDDVANQLQDQRPKVEHGRLGELEDADVFEVCLII